MSRDIPSVVQSWASEVANRPVELYQVFLDRGILRFAQSDVDVPFGGETWTAMGIGRGEIRTSTELECDEVSVSIDNVNLAMADRIIAEDFVARRLVIYKLRRGDVASGQAMVLFDGRMDEPVLDQSKLVLAIRSWLDGMHVAVPRRIFSAICNYQLYDQWCTVTREGWGAFTNVKSGMAIGSSTHYTLVSPDLTEADQRPALGVGAYTGWGPISTLWMQTGSNAGLAREVIDYSVSSNSVEMRIPFPFTINSGDYFFIERGCVKTYIDCANKFGNWVNYGGFPTIPRAGLQIDMPTLGAGGGGGKK